MSSVAKTLELLAFFAPLRPEIGLTQMAGLAGRDKATTYRHLQALEAAGFVEQDAGTKLYRLGPALLQLGQMRERTVPRKTAAAGPLAALGEATGETVHVSVLSGQTLYPLVSRESQVHGTRAIIDIQTFALHATASGLCALAFGPDGLLEAAVQKMTAYTDTTVSTRAGLEAAMQATRAAGFARANRSFEDDINSLGAPLFDARGFAGAVSVACVASRFTPALEQIALRSLTDASRAITRNWGGTLPAELEAAWAATLSFDTELDSVS